MASLALIRGLPGSGKSTLAKALQESLKALHFEADMFFIDSITGEYKFDGMKIGDAHEWCHTATRTMLEAGCNVIVSNTFTKLSEMNSYFEIAKDLGLALPNVILCQGIFGSVHGVPDQVMINMRKRFAYDISPLVDKFKDLE